MSETRSNQPATIVVTCPRCGQTYRPSRGQIWAGTWQRCPYCADGDETTRVADAAARASTKG